MIHKERTTMILTVLYVLLPLLGKLHLIYYQQLV